MSIELFSQNLIAVQSEDAFSKFLIASRDGDISFMRSFLATSPHRINDADHDSRASATHFAANRSNLEGLRLLLDSGAQLGNHTRVGSSEIHYAVINNNLAITDLLISKKRDLINQTVGDGSGWNPVMLASYYGNCDMLNLLMVNGANINAQKTDGESALIISIKNEKFDTVRLLLDQGNINVSLKTLNGNTALHYIADSIRGEADLVGKILESDSLLLNEVNNKGESALALSIGSGNFAIASFLLQQDGIVIDDKARDFLSQQNSLFDPIRAKVAKIDKEKKIEEVASIPNTSTKPISSSFGLSSLVDQIVEARDEEARGSGLGNKSRMEKKISSGR